MTRHTRHKVTKEDIFSGEWDLDIRTSGGRLTPVLSRDIAIALNSSDPPDSTRVYGFAKEKFQGMAPLNHGDVKFYYSGMEDPMTLEVLNPKLIAEFLRQIDQDPDPRHKATVRLRLDGNDRLFMPGDPVQVAMFPELEYAKPPLPNPFKITPMLAACLKDCGLNRDTVKHILPYQSHPTGRPGDFTADENRTQAARVKAVLDVARQNIPGHNK